MDKVKEHQTSLRLIGDTETDIAGALSQRIKYTKQDNATGSFPATVLNATAGTIYYDVTATSDLTPSGEWKIWGYVTFSDGRSAPGNTHILTIYKEGE